MLLPRTEKYNSNIFQKYLKIGSQNISETGVIKLNHYTSENVQMILSQLYDLK